MAVRRAPPETGGGPGSQLRLERLPRLERLLEVLRLRPEVLRLRPELPRRLLEVLRLEVLRLEVLRPRPEVLLLVREVFPAVPRRGAVFVSPALRRSLFTVRAAICLAR